MSALTKTILKRPVAALVIVVGLIIFGATSLGGLSLQLIPDMNLPVMLVRTTYPQAAPEDIDRLVTTVIEENCGSISGIDTIYSQSAENLSMTMLQFDYGTDMDKAFIDVQEAVERMKSRFPDEVEDPTILTVNMNAQPVMMLSVDADEGEDALYYANNDVTDELKKISDVAQVNVSGGNENYISVQLVPEYVQQYNLDIPAVTAAIKAANFSLPAGSADFGDQTLSLASKVEYKTPDEISRIPITTASGDIIHLGDVALVSYDTKTPTAYSRYNNKDNVTISMTKVQSSSAVTLANKAYKAIEKLNEQHPEFRIETIYDSSETIKNSIKTIAETLLVGVLLTMAVLFLFFGDLKGSLIVGSSMPVSLLLTFILMNFLGFTLNLVTMGALVIGIGMMVDNAIVVIEMIFRKRDEGLDFMDAAYEGTKIVINSIIASTITTVVVYLPLAMMKGLSGQMFGQLGYTIIFSLLTSLFSAITLVPLCFSQYKPVEKKESRINHILEKLGERYSRLLKKALHRRKTVAFTAIAIFAVSIFLFKFCNVELMGSSDEGRVNIGVDFRPGTRVDVIDAKVRELEQFASESPYIRDYSAESNETSAYGSVSCYVSDDCDLTTAEIVDEWTPVLKEYEDSCEISVSGGSSMGMTGSGGGNTYAVSLESTNLDLLKEGARVAADAIATVPGVITVNSGLSNGATRAEVKVDPMRASAAGMTPQQVANALYAIMSGSKAMEVSIDGRDYNVRVEFPEGEYETVNDVMGLTLTNARGQAVPVSDIADIVYTDTPTSIDKQNSRYRTEVTATLTAEAKFSAQGAIEEKIAQTRLPEGVDQTVNSENEMMQEEFGAIIKAIIVAILLVYMVMAIEFENLRYSGMVMFCIPFSLIGSILLLLVTRCTISMVSLMGFLMLIGIVVNNGILYVDYTNQLRQGGMTTEDALIATGVSRLRPILMTTLTTVLSMIPMTLGLGKNGKMMQSMAVVIVGGLSASTILTLVLLPTFYMIIHRKSKAKKQKLKAIADGTYVEPKKKRRWFKRKKDSME